MPVSMLLRTCAAVLIANMVPFGSVHAQTATTTEDYGKLPGFEDAAISPSGNRVALLATVKDLRTLIVVEGGKTIQQSELGDVKVRDIEWASNDLLMVDYSQTEKLYGFTTDKAEFYRTILISMTGAPLTVLFAKQKQIATATFGWYGVRDIDGKSYGFFGGVPMEAVGQGDYVFRGGPPALYRVDLSDMKTKQIANRAAEGERNNAHPARKQRQLADDQR
jgi:hypothetical protein